MATCEVARRPEVGMCCRTEQMKNVPGSIKLSSHGALKHQLFICAVCSGSFSILCCI